MKSTKLETLDTKLKENQPNLLKAFDSLADAASDLGELLWPKEQGGDAADDDELGHAEPKEATATKAPRGGPSLTAPSPYTDQADEPRLR